MKVQKVTVYLHPSEVDGISEEQLVAIPAIPKNRKIRILVASGNETYGTAEAAALKLVEDVFQGTVHGEVQAISQHEFREVIRNEYPTVDQSKIDDLDDETLKAIEQLPFISVTFKSTSSAAKFSVLIESNITTALNKAKACISGGGYEIKSIDTTNIDYICSTDEGEDD